eukprot:scaffold68136_cov37-Prasinocladus_malaysianus.AAC.1
MAMQHLSGLMVFDVGLCENCFFKQELVFPTLKASIDVKAGDIIVSDATIPHGASLPVKTMLDVNLLDIDIVLSFSSRIIWRGIDLKSFTLNRFCKMEAKTSV